MKKLLSILVLLLFISCNSSYKQGEKYLKQSKLRLAKTTFEGIPPTDKNYDLAQIQIKKIDSTIIAVDSIITFRKNEDLRLDSIKAHEEKIFLDSVYEERYQKEFEKLKNYDPGLIVSAKDVFIELDKIRTFRKTLESIKKSSQPETQKLYSSFKSTLVSKQVKYFPVLRKAYCEQAKEFLWKDDIDVKCSGANTTILELIAVELASNKYKDQYYQDLKDSLYKLRFKRFNLSWSKYSDEYTYYNLDVLKDSDISYNENY